MSVGIKRGGSGLGSFSWMLPGHRCFSGHIRISGAAARAGREDRGAGRYTGRHARPRGETARTRAGKAVPATAAAATLVAGTAAYLLVGGGHPQAAELSANLPVRSAGVVALGGGQANAAAAMLGVASVAGHQAAPAATARVRPATSPKAAPSPAKPTAAKPAPAKPASSPASSASSASVAPAVRPTQAASQPPQAATLTCSLSSGLLPANVTSIVSFLLTHGYSHNAAAGIAGNIYQESKGNPESVGMGGGGLIGWTPLPSGFVTGNPAADLQTQLTAILTYNQQWASYLPALNSAASPASAAYIYVTDFERAGIPAASTREASAQAVATACGL